MKDQRVLEVLDQWGASSLPHPGGTLLEHLVRTAALLRSWQATEPVILAGLAHATYGTDGFDTALLPLNQRRVLHDLIGADAEALVYRYASCDRTYLMPQLGRRAVLSFRDRFEDTIVEVPEQGLRPFMELTFANELDVMRQNQTFAERNGPEIGRLFRRCRYLVSPAAYEGFEVFEAL